MAVVGCLNPMKNERFTFAVNRRQTPQGLLVGTCVCNFDSM